MYNMVKTGIQIIENINGRNEIIFVTQGSNVFFEAKNKFDVKHGSYSIWAQVGKNVEY